MKRCGAIDTATVIDTGYASHAGATAYLLVLLALERADAGRVATLREVSILIGLAIPASFLMGMLALSLWGFTVNIVVLFSLILAVGMLVDDAIIVTEYAERRMSEGMGKREAFALASHKMAGPVIAATTTRIVVRSIVGTPALSGRSQGSIPRQPSRLASG